MECALAVTEVLISEGEESSANQVKTGFMQNGNVLLTGKIKKMQEIVWIFSFCADKGTTEDTQYLMVFKRYVNDIPCFVKKNLLENLEYAIFRAKKFNTI